MDHVEKQIEIGFLCSTPSHSEIDIEDEGRKEQKKTTKFYWRFNFNRLAFEKELIIIFGYYLANLLILLLSMCQQHLDLEPKKKNVHKNSIAIPLSLKYNLILLTEKRTKSILIGCSIN